jgi:long-chain fatty acid transport protein
LYFFHGKNSNRKGAGGEQFSTIKRRILMKLRKITWMQCLILVVALIGGTAFLAGDADATNGDNLISIGPISRAMGGVGIAAPQDAISAVFSNPAAMCFGLYCPGSEFNFAGTIFMPQAKTDISLFGGGSKGEKSSDSDMFAIPAIGISSPITQDLRFGLAAYGVSGLGVDYRDKFDLNPSAQGDQAVYTNLQIMKFAPSLSYLVNPNFSIGGALHIDYGSLDLGDGTSSGFAFGAELGAIYKTGPLSFGLVYISPQKINHEDVANFDEAFGSNSLDNLKLESPTTLGFGIAYEPILNTLLLEADVKWLNWSNADGYEDFGWDDQWVFNVGAQYKPIPKLALRVGYNYGKNPVKTHSWSDFDGPVDVQGHDVPRTNYEILRIAGFPAIVEHHITAGVGYQLTKTVSVDIAYMHAFKKTIEESGTAAMPDGMGGYVVDPNASVEASLYEDSIEFGITWRF